MLETKRKTTWLMSALLFLLFVSSLPACLSDSETCGDDMKLVENDFGQYCTPKKKKNTDNPPEDTSEEDLDAGADAAPSTDDEGGLPAGMGDECLSDADCTEEADYCHFPPGETVGECSFSNCSTDPDDCPEGFGCFDWTLFGVDNLPTVCIPEQYMP